LVDSIRAELAAHDANNEAMLRSLGPVEAIRLANLGLADAAGNAAGAIDDVTEAQLLRQVVDLIMLGQNAAAEELYEVYLQAKKAADRVAAITAGLEALNGKSVTAYINLVSSGGAPYLGGAIPTDSGGGKKGAVKVYDQNLKRWFWKNPDGSYTPAQHGLHMVVPPNFPNDSFMIGATSGEEIDIKTKEQQKAGAIGGGGSGGDTYIYKLTAQYGFQSERSLRDDVRVLELLHSG
jgi:hypothetical protein